MHMLAFYAERSLQVPNVCGVIELDVAIVDM